MLQGYDQEAARQEQIRTTLGSQICSETNPGLPAAVNNITPQVLKSAKMRTESNEPSRHPLAGATQACGAQAVRNRHAVGDHHQ